MYEKKAYFYFFLSGVLFFHSIFLPLPRVNKHVQHYERLPGDAGPLQTYSNTTTGFSIHLPAWASKTNTLDFQSVGQHVLPNRLFQHILTLEHYHVQPWRKSHLMPHHILSHGAIFHEIAILALCLFASPAIVCEHILVFVFFTVSKALISKDHLSNDEMWNQVIHEQSRAWVSHDEWANSPFHRMFQLLRTINTRWVRLYVLAASRDFPLSKREDFHHVWCSRDGASVWREPKMDV